MRVSGRDRRCRPLPADIRPPRARMGFWQPALDPRPDVYGRYLPPPILRHRRHGRSPDLLPAFLRTRLCAAKRQPVLRKTLHRLALARYADCTAPAPCFRRRRHPREGAPAEPCCIDITIPGGRDREAVMEKLVAKEKELSRLREALRSSRPMTPQAAHGKIRNPWPVFHGSTGSASKGSTDDPQYRL